MNRNWDDAAADTFTYLNQGKRAFPAKKMPSMLDDLAVQGSVTQAYLMEKHGSAYCLLTLPNAAAAQIRPLSFFAPYPFWTTSRKNDQLMRAATRPDRCLRECRPHLSSPG
jgi:hypothetical protein